MLRHTERSPTPLRANYDFTLRHERAKLFHKIVSQCDSHVARTAQVVRDLASTVSQVAQSYYEVSLCVNNVNPSTASILQSGRTATGAGGEEARKDGDRVPKPNNVFVSRRTHSTEISYKDGVVASYGASLQSAAKIFASESRGLKEGKHFSVYSEGIHNDVLAKLRAIQTAAKQTVDSGNETNKFLKKFERCRKLVSLKEKKYARSNKPISTSKRYKKQLAEMHNAEEMYTSKLAYFDEKYEHLFQRDLYVTGHTLDNFLDVNFTFMSHLMQLIGCLAPSAAATVEQVVLEGGEAMGKRMGIPEESRLASQIRQRRATATATSKNGGGGNAQPASKIRNGAAAAATAKSSHNFTTYFSTRRDEPKRGGVRIRSFDSVIDVDKAPPTTRNDDESHLATPAAATGMPTPATPLLSSPQKTPTRPAAAAATDAKKMPTTNTPAEDKKIATTAVGAAPVRTATTATGGAGVATPNAKGSATARVAPAPAHAREGTLPPADTDEPEPRAPQQPTKPEAKGAATRTPERHPSCAPYGDTPSVVNCTRRPGPQQPQKRRESSPPAHLDANGVGGDTGGRAMNPLAQRARDFSPSCEPFGYGTLHEEVRAASVDYTALSRGGDNNNGCPRHAPPPPLLASTAEKRAPPHATAATAGRRKEENRNARKDDNAEDESPSVSRCVFPDRANTSNGSRSSGKSHNSGGGAAAAASGNRKPTSAITPTPTPAVVAKRRMLNSSNSSSHALAAAANAKPHAAPFGNQAEMKQSGRSAPTAIPTPSANPLRAPVAATASSSTAAAPVAKCPVTPRASANTAPTRAVTAASSVAARRVPVVSAPPPESESDGEGSAEEVKSFAMNHSDLQMSGGVTAPAAAAAAAVGGARTCPIITAVTVSVTPPTAPAALASPTMPVAGMATTSLGGSLRGGTASPMSLATPQARPPLSPGGVSMNDVSEHTGNPLPRTSSCSALSISGTNGRQTVAAAVCGSGVSGFGFPFDSSVSGSASFPPVSGGNTSVSGVAGAVAPFQQPQPQQRLYIDPCATGPNAPSSAASVSGGATPQHMGGFSGASTPAPGAGLVGNDDADRNAFYTAAWEEVHLAKPADDY